MKTQTGFGQGHRDIRRIHMWEVSLDNSVRGAHHNVSAKYLPNYLSPLTTRIFATVPNGRWGNRTPSLSGLIGSNSDADTPHRQHLPLVGPGHTPALPFAPRPVNLSGLQPGASPSHPSPSSGGGGSWSRRRRYTPRPTRSASPSWTSRWTLEAVVLEETRRALSIPELAFSAISPLSKSRIVAREPVPISLEPLRVQKGYFPHMFTRKHHGGQNHIPARNHTGRRKHPAVTLEGGHILSLTSALFKAARLSATARAASRGPKPLAKRAARITISRGLARTGIFRWPK